MDWIIFLSQLPTKPSSLRVFVWRKMRAAGALGIQNGVWVLPDTSLQNQFLQELSATIQEQGAGCQIFRVKPMDEEVEKDILARFSADRKEEYEEFIEQARLFLAEMEKESGNKKFTFAELEENEQQLQRLEKWIEKITGRDFTGGEMKKQAVEILDECKLNFDVFSSRVYDQHVDTP